MNKLLRITQNAFKLPTVEMLRCRRALWRVVYVAMVVGVAVLVTTQLSSAWSRDDHAAASRQHASCKLVNCNYRGTGLGKK